MRTKKEINKKINQLYSSLQMNEIEPIRTIIYTDALCWVLGDDYLDEYKLDFKALYETKVDEVDTLYRIIMHIHKELSLLKLKDCPEEEFHNIPLEICEWIEKLAKIRQETGIDKDAIHK